MTFDPSKSWSLQEELQQLITQIEAVPFWVDESSSIWLEDTASFWLDDSNSSASSDDSSTDMNNTKRKFNALLNSIGSSSSDDLTRTTKQARTSYDGAFPRSSTSSPNLSTSSRTAAVARMSKTDLKFAAANSAKARGTDEPVTKPSFLPGDREDFLERLATFRNLTDWMPKPPKVNEVAWAKRGWACQRLERVRCVTCSVEIMVKLNKQEDENGKLIKFAGMESDIEQALVDKYADLMITSHDVLCPWRKRGCDDSIFKQPIYPITTTFQALKSRYDSLLPIAALLPAESVFLLPPAYDLDAIIAQLPHPFPANESQEAPLNRVALLLALFGFTARPAHVPKLGSADCRVCFRTVGLWLYRPKTSKPADGSPGVERAAAMASLNPLECHKEYCPWVNAGSQNGGVAGGKPIWSILGEAIGREDKVRKQDEAGKGEKGAAAGGEATHVETEGDARDEGEYEKMRDEKDKERWARLRKVKSLFEGKGKKVAKTKH
ncbi:hypothetical protein VE01_04968 [Pseudogymnoascus verrucosus]|uniref:C3HC-type domain-containing protein n=1 Tax=Pseudogymnoascus verrucosus TaxID=342668 RepID=A0A1B8GPL0_9PEZI|nr:uncharacterized protein VE01_04968 [Pseudogymnoascus verrucosus]OBT97767.1 hypothetical protein VE01_04968 [Pseudogymnoascus verrucosus]